MDVSLKKIRVNLNALLTWTSTNKNETDNSKYG